MICNRHSYGPIAILRESSNLMTPVFVLVTPLQADIKNPTIQQIADLVAVLPHAIPNLIQEGGDFLILEKQILEKQIPTLEDINSSYMQARPHREPKYEGVFLIEVRDGVAGRHYAGHLEAAFVPAVFESYLQDDDTWRELLVWRDISFCFEALIPSLPPEELASSFFAEDEWKAALAAKKERDDEFWDLLDDEIT
jgi:hypothetical protein